MRKDSVYNCLTQTDSDIVLIHDSAQPLIKREYITKCIENINNFNEVSIAVKSKDTIKVTDDEGIVIKTTKKKNTWIIQTPQCFRRKVLLVAHEEFKTNELITDDCVLLEMMNEKVKLIKGDYTNIKITHQGDIDLINEFLKK